MKRLFFKDARCIDREGQTSGPKTLVVENGLIAWLGDEIGDGRRPSGEGRTFFPGPSDEIIPCKGLFISPGLVNLHTHSPMNIFKGIAEDASPDRWFNEEIWPYESKMQGDDVEAGASMAIAEMLDNGVTAFADHYFFADRICKAVHEMGIRADIAPTLFGSVGNMQSQLDGAAALIGEWKGRSPRISLRLGPHSPYTCSPDDLAQCAKMAQALGVGAHIHVEDGEGQVAASLQRWGQTPMEIVSRSGLMDVPLIVGHAWWLLDKERELIKTGTWIAVCMKTYMKLGEGPGRAWALSDDFPLCIGTDGAASSNGLSPIEQVRLLGLVGKYMRKDAEAFPLERLWRILMRGHDALPFGTGSLSAGAPADFLVWDLHRPNTFPVYNPLAAIIYSSDPRNVLHSVIDGRFMKRDGVLLLDTEAIVARAGACAEGIIARGKGRSSLVF